MKESQRKRMYIADAIRFELGKGEHTYTICECGRHGARSMRCWECLLEDLI